MMEESFQEQSSVLHCHGCGADNEKGLQIRSYWDGDEAVCEWRPESHHCGGSKQIVNGGIVATLIDCHSLNLAIAHAYKSEGRPIGSVPKIGYVTGNLNVSYLRPTPIDEALRLRAKILKIEGRKTWVSCTLSAAGEIRATGEVLGIRIER
jgi:acyl-coenzyme A thioesterase PaaI-like protein